MYNPIIIESFSHFIEMIEGKDKNELILFRGQANDDPLLPKIARKTPLVDSSETEKKMIKDLLRRSNEFLQPSMKTDWNLLALGQHHGLTTRLLDWTTNPLVALWFACSSRISRDQNSVVWMFLVPDNAILDITKDTTPFDAGKTKVFQPNIVGKRLAIQSGWFTVHKYSKTATPNRFVPLEGNPDQSNNLIKLLIPKKLRLAFISDLNTCGINSSTIFPELDGLCMHINWTYLH